MNTNSLDKRRRTQLGAVALIGLGGAMLLYQITPHFVHGALTTAMMALVFGALFMLGGPRFGWAKVPATIFSVLSGIVLLTSLPHEGFHMWWPIVLVIAGLWILRPSRAWAR